MVEEELTESTMALASPLEHTKGLSDTQVFMLTWHGPQAPGEIGAQEREELS